LKTKKTEKRKRKFLYIKIADELHNNGDQSKRNSQRDTLFHDYRYRSNSNPDENQSTNIHFFPSRRNVTKYYRKIYLLSFF